MDRAVGARRLSIALPLLAILFVFAASAWAASSKVVVQGLNDPRGIAAGDGRLLVVQTGTGEITEVRKGKDGAVTKTFATLPGANDVVNGRHGKAYAVVTMFPEQQGAEPAAQLFRIDKDGNPSLIADIGAYQKTDPDPFDQEGVPEESNPNGLAYLGKHGILVADAANNDLLRVRKDGSIQTVARFPTKDLPGPEGTVHAEAVPTSVTVGPDGAWYVSELTGFPFTKGASRIWRIKPGTKDHNCDPDAKSGPCRVFADGFTSVIDIAFSGDTLYVLEIVKEGLASVEGSENPPPPVGALWAVNDDGSKTELVPGKLLAPGGVAVAHEDTLYVTTGTVLGPGAGEVVRVTGLDEDDGDEGRDHDGDDDSHHHGSGGRDHGDDDDHGSRKRGDGGDRDRHHDGGSRRHHDD